MNFVFCGIGQYNKVIQYLFKKLCIFNQFLSGGWFDIQEQIFIQENAVVLNLTNFNKFLVKLLLKREKEFLLSPGYKIKQDTIEHHKNGFTKFQDSSFFIIPSKLNFVEFKNL